jgi:hypothetical protein
MYDCFRWALGQSLSESTNGHGAEHIYYIYYQSVPQSGVVWNKNGASRKIRREDQSGTMSIITPGTGSMSWRSTTPPGRVPSSSGAPQLHVPGSTKIDPGLLPCLLPSERAHPIRSLPGIST